MSPVATIWARPEQTDGKHIVLEAYLGAWMAILGQAHERFVFIDGFAGPGAYEDGERGSPLIALDVFEQHRARTRFIGKPSFLFLEEDRNRQSNLEALLEPYRQRLGNAASIESACGDFQGTFSRLLDALDADGRRLAPSFVMVDPFGVSNVPLSLLRRVLINPSTELFVSFMYESINRFKETREFEPHLDALFGTDSWRRMHHLPSHARKEFALQLYADQLRSVGARFVLRLELWKRNRFVYAIFFATQHPKGCDRMKAAMWKADPSGAYQFRSSMQGQSVLFGADSQQLQQQICSVFAGQTVSVDQLESWIQTDATPFHSGQLKAALRGMEDSNLIVVDSTTRTKRRTFPSTTRLQILG